MMKFKRMGELSHSDTYDGYFFFFQLIFILTLGYSIISWLFRLWRQYKQLKNDKAAAELALLKSKIDPHFFFNTLNNLYGLAIEKSEETPKIILKLSEVMRHTIYEGENETVAIKDEVLYLEQYIEIHKIRYKKNVSIVFKKDIDDFEKQIPPLLFIVLVENAFKHGIESLTDNAYINIKLTTRKHLIFFSLENNYEFNNQIKKGIGLDNLKRRLQLLYPKKHELSLTTVKDIFKAELTIFQK